MRRWAAVWAALLWSTTVQAGWIALRSPGLELYTDASEKSARVALDRLANIRRLLPENDPEPTPLRIVLFDSERDYRAVAPTPKSDGFYQSGPERDFIVMPAGAQLSRVVVHEYVHFALNPRGKRRPMWIEEGLAEFYSNAQFTAQTAKLGSPIEEHLEMLKRRAWLTPVEIEAGREDPLFYALAWGLVHMFRHQPTFPEHLEARDLEDLRRYLKNVQTQVIPAPPSISAPKIAVESISALDALLVRADLALRTGHNAVAKTVVDQAVREFPNTPAVATLEGRMAMALGDEAGARVHFERALRMDDRNADAWFERALLDHDDAALVRAAELNPNLGEARLLLGVHATDDGELPTALTHLREAVRLMPLKSYAWYSLAFAQVKAGQAEDAKASLQRAFHTAASPEQTAMARALMSSLEGPSGLPH